MTRSDIGKRHLSLLPVLSSNTDRIINSLDKKVRMGRKIHNIINYIKANGLYSEKEMELENLNIQRLKCNNREKQILKKAWDIRHKINDKVLDDFESLIKEFENE